MDQVVGPTSPTAAELRDALQRNEIVPYFQPQLDLRSGMLTGFEVLARWPHPERCMIPPSEFIPLAERAGLIGILTDHILRNACLAAVDWPAEIGLSVNVSPLELQDQTLPERLCAIADATGFPVNRLVFEITESAIVANPEIAREIIAELKAFGAQIALDDFGTGYSSLQQLQALPFDKLKVDASFVRSMTHQRSSRKIVAAVIGLGLSLGLSTVAEGVENQQQADMLTALGCDQGQGWLFGRPVSAAEATRALADDRWNRTGIVPATRFAAEIAMRLEASPSRRLAQLQAVYDGAPVGLALLDRDFRYISLNRRLAEMHHCSVADHVGRTVKELLPQQFDKLEPHLARALRGEAVPDLRIPWAPADNPDDRHRFVVSYHPVRDESDEVVGISVAVVDVTGLQDNCHTEPPKQLAPISCTGDVQLTERQSDVMRLVAEGQSVKEIARRLDLGIGTVKSHLSRAYCALGARNRIEAINLAAFNAMPAFGSAEAQLSRH